MNKITTPFVRLPILIIAMASIFALQACANQSNINKETVVQRPTFKIETDERFRPGDIPALEGDFDDIYAHIEKNIDAHIANMQRWIRQPSISSQNVGIMEMATMLRDDLADIGFEEAELVPTDGHPGVWGYYNANAEKTLVVYMMYDVQPVGFQKWRVKDPFAAEIIDMELGKAIMARGADNQKGPERAFLNAVESIIKVRGSLPINIMIVADGEEEIGSPHYGQIINQYADRLREAEGMTMPGNTQAPDGNVTLILGVNGLLYIQLKAKGGPHGGPVSTPIHSSAKTVVDSPAWRLVHALAALTTADGNTITVPGYYDDISPPTLSEQRAINALADEWELESWKSDFGVERFIDDIDNGQDFYLNFLYTSTININGVSAGHVGLGQKTILPNQAFAKLESRLPPDMDPDEAFDKIREHLDKNGFKDIEMQKLAAFPAARTDIGSPFVSAAIAAVKKSYAAPDIVFRYPSSGPGFYFTDQLKLPMSLGGVGLGANSHAPNEFMLLWPKPGVKAASIIDIEKFYVDLLFSFAKASK